MTTTTYWDEVDAAWDDRPHARVPRRLGPMRGGVFAAAVLLGMRDALEARVDDEIVVEVDVDRPAEPVDGIALHFDAASPKRTIAVVGADRSKIAAQRLGSSAGGRCPARVRGRVVTPPP